MATLYGSNAAGELVLPPPDRRAGATSQRFVGDQRAITETISPHEASRTAVPSGTGTAYPMYLWRMADRRRTAALAAAFLLAACGAQALAPRPSAPASPPSRHESPSSAAPTTSSAPTIAANDLLYIRGWRIPGGSWSDGSGIALLDARTGTVVRGMVGGILSSDRNRVYATELMDGGTRTIVHVSDLSSGRELRTFAVDGGYHVVFGSNNAPGGLSDDDDRWLTLAQDRVKIDGAWLTKLVVVATANAAVVARVDLKDDIYGYFGIAPNGTWLYLTEYRVGGTRLRVWDVRKASFVTEQALGASWDGAQNGYLVGPLSSGNGRWLYAIDTGGNGSSPVVRALDTAATDAAPRKMMRLALPEDQRSDDFEKYMLWSLALTRDGRTLYAVNPALGVADEIDTTRMELRRTSRVGVSRLADGPLAWAGRLVFPVAEAKRVARRRSPLVRRTHALRGRRQGCGGHRHGVARVA